MFLIFMEIRLTYTFQSIFHSQSGRMDLWNAMKKILKYANNNNNNVCHLGTFLHAPDNGIYGKFPFLISEDTWCQKAIFWISRPLTFSACRLPPYVKSIIAWLLFQIKEIKNLDHLSDLRVLNLAGNQIEHVRNLTGLNLLTELNLRRNKIRTVVGDDDHCLFCSAVEWLRIVWICTAEEIVFAKLMIGTIT